MGKSEAFIAIAAVAALIVLVAVRLIRPRVQRSWFAGTGIDRWRHKASHLPWRDRWVLFWANSLGRAAPVRLAPLAVERGEVVLAMTERMGEKGSGVRRFWQVLGIWWVVLLIFNIWLFAEGQSEGWTNLLVPLIGLCCVFGAIGPAQSWQARLLQRSIERNRVPLGRGD